VKDTGKGKVEGVFETGKGAKELNPDNQAIRLKNWKEEKYVLDEGGV